MRVQSGIDLESGLQITDLCATRKLWHLDISRRESQKCCRGRGGRFLLRFPFSNGEIMVFEKGHSGGPGRPNGSRNKLSEGFLKALAEDFEAHGVEAIKTVREADPSTYLKVIARLLPKDVHITERPLVEWSTAELVAGIDGLEELMLENRERGAKHADGDDDDTGQIH